jgi:branched-subunit amino acid transport protein AzlD
MTVMEMVMLTAVLASGTVIPRAVPFVCFSRREPPKALLMIEDKLPLMILMLLVIYCIKDVEWLVSPYGLPEVLSIGLVATVHLWRRNAMLSIFAGIGCYMILVQTDVLSSLL